MQKIKKITRFRNFYHVYSLCSKRHGFTNDYEDRKRGGASCFTPRDGSFGKFTLSLLITLIARMKETDNTLVTRSKGGAKYWGLEAN
jgi:hypothetical protein